MADTCVNCGVKLACLGWRTCFGCDLKKRRLKEALRIKNQIKREDRKRLLTSLKKDNNERKLLAESLHQPSIEIINSEKFKRKKKVAVYFKTRDIVSEQLICEKCGEKYLKPLGCLLCKHYIFKLQRASRN